MSRDVHAIPPAPRHVRLRTLLHRRWVLGLFGLLFGIYGGLFALMLSAIADSGLLRSDRELDRANSPARATVTRVEPSAAGPAYEKVHFGFQTGNGRDYLGECFAPAGKFKVGMKADAEYVPEIPDFSRLVGTRVALVPAGRILHLWLLFIFLPGLCMLLVWIVSTLRYRALLQFGDVAVAEILNVQRRRAGMPSWLDVSFRFRDHHAKVCEGHATIGGTTALGKRLVDGATRAPVIHDRLRPWRCSLVTSEDFVAPIQSKDGMAPRWTGTG